MAPRDEFQARAQEKEASRDADARDLSSGARSQDQVRRENGAFAFPPERIRLNFARSSRLA